MKGYSHIVVGTDFSEASARAVETAARLADSMGARLTLVHVFEPAPYIAGIHEALTELDREIEASARAELDRCAERWLAGVAAERVALRHRSAAAAITDLAEETNADLCIVGTHGRSGIERLLIGSVAEKVVRHAHSDVLTVHPMASDDVPLARPVVVATDFSSASLAAIDAAAWLAGRAPLEVHLVHVFDDSVPVPLAQGGFEGDDETRRRLWEALSGIRAERFPDNPRVATAVLTARSAVDGLCAYAAQHAAGLMVVGTHGRTGISRLLIGSVAERVVRQAPCSVLCVRNRES